LGLSFNIILFFAKKKNFFEKVNSKIERGYKREDISYQLDLSANNLREIIKEYPAREVEDLFII
jgi:hypothetical protein